MGERAIGFGTRLGERATTKKPSRPKEPSRPKATSKVPFNCSSELAVFLIELKERGAAYTVEAGTNGGWLVDITGV